MKKKWRHLNIYIKALSLDLCALLVINLGMIPLWINHLPDIPQGLLLGGLYGVLCLLVMFLVTNKENEDKKLVGTIIVIIARLLILAGILLLVGYLYYVKDIKIFNIFAVVGGYLLSTISLALSHLIFKEEEEE